MTAVALGITMRDAGLVQRRMQRAVGGQERIVAAAVETDRRQRPGRIAKRCEHAAVGRRVAPATAVVLDQRIELGDVGHRRMRGGGGEPVRMLAGQPQCAEAAHAQAGDQ
jgi:hypothetical protein